MIRLLALLLLLAGPARATVDGWPALFDVTGVAADDVLNVRAAPSAGAPVIGTLAPDARGVEVIRPTRDLRWGRVNLGDQAGWAALAYLQRRPGQWDGAIPDSLTCTGTEPFWSLRLDPGATRLDRPEGAALTAGPAARQPAEGRRDVWAFRAWAEGRGLSGFVTRAACSDGMSDRDYGLRVEFLELLGDGFTAYSGCCSLAP